MHRAAENADISTANEKSMQHEGEDEIEQALRLIHQRASDYRGPLVREFMELARVSAPPEKDEYDAVDAGEAAQRPIDTDEDPRRERKQRLQDALSLLMSMAFPVHKGTEEAVRRDLTRLLNADKPIKTLAVLDGEREIRLATHLGRRPTRRQMALQELLQRYMPFVDREVEL